jgi:hypothetical protein
MTTYIITPEAICFTQPDKTYLVDKSYGSMFHYLKFLLTTGQHKSLKKAIDIKSYIKLICPGLEVDNKGEYVHNGQNLGVLSHTLQKFIKESLPLTPVLKFIENASVLPSKVKSDLFNLVGTGKLTLTWDGNLVAYRRASWKAKEVSATTEVQDSEEYRLSYEDFKKQLNNNFTPGEYIESKDSTGLFVSDFDWAATSCPDQGAFYDVKVFVSDVISITSKKCLNVKGFTCLSKLAETYVNDSSFTSLLKVDLSTNVYGQRVVVKQPVTLEETKDFLLNIYNNVKVNTDKETHSVKVTASC